MANMVTIRLGDDLADALDREACETGLSRGEIVRRAIAAYLAKSGRLTIMSRHFGTVRGPADLSMNKAYRRPFAADLRPRR